MVILSFFKCIFGFYLLNFRLKFLNLWSWGLLSWSFSDTVSDNVDLIKWIRKYSFLNFLKIVSSLCINDILEELSIGFTDFLYYFCFTLHWLLIFIISLHLLTWGLIFSFYIFLRWKLRSLIWDFPSFLILIYNSIYVPLEQHHPQIFEMCLIPFLIFYNFPLAFFFDTCTTLPGSV